MHTKVWIWGGCSLHIINLALSWVIPVDAEAFGSTLSEDSGK